MKLATTTSGLFEGTLLGLAISWLGWASLPMAHAAEDRHQKVWIRSIEGANFEISPAGARDWIVPDLAKYKSMNPGDRGRTGAGTRLILQVGTKGVIRIAQNTEFEIQPPLKSDGSWRMTLQKGFSYFFHRGEPGDIRVHSSVASAAVKGTEFAVQVDALGQMALTVIHGQVELSNRVGRVVLADGEQGKVVNAGLAPYKTPVVNTMREIQWCLYYPGVLDPTALGLDNGEPGALQQSLSAYAEGDFLQAYHLYPKDRQPQTFREAVYLAALHLSFGGVSNTEGILASATMNLGDPASLSQADRLAKSLRQMIRIIQQEAWMMNQEPQTSSEWLVASYGFQSRFELKQALAAAQKSVEMSPRFGFGWIRVAELQFCFGRTRQATEALHRGMELCPRHAMASTLQGFMEMSRLRLDLALPCFEKALSQDGGLADAWLGQGLVRIQQRATSPGQEDLEIAAAVEPQRSLLRSYLGKAYHKTGDFALANKELDLAILLDSNDPTPWLYSALILRDQNRFNEAILDLKQSKGLNDNRRLYRSRLLLDQDQAVRGSQLATLYGQNGMKEFAYLEAAKSVDAEYANFSAHRFLSDSYNQLRDPQRIQLRYETPWRNEQLLASLMSPAGSGPVSQIVTLNEYSRMFQVDGLALNTMSEFWSGQAFRQTSSQLGNFGPHQYSVDMEYYSQDGFRKNNEMDRQEWQAQYKYHASPNDSLFLQARYKDQSSGDVFQYYDPDTEADPDLDFQESQKGTVLAGYHHQWSPGVHSLVLGGRLVNEQNLSDQDRPHYQLRMFDDQVISKASRMIADLNYKNKFETYSAELNQIFQGERSRAVFGARAYRGSIEAENHLRLQYVQGVNGNLDDEAFTNSPARWSESIDEGLFRYSGYGYFRQEVHHTLALTAGASYDYLKYPRHYKIAPISPGSSTEHAFSPKAALEWQPLHNLTLRGAYSQSLSGVEFEDNIRLEPTQMAGIVQGYRSVIPETVAGSVPAASMEVRGAALDWKFGDRHYFNAQLDWLGSDGEQYVGVYRELEVPPMARITNEISSAKNKIDYEEISLQGTYNLLLSRDWAFSLGYRFTDSDLKQTLPAAEPTAIKNRITDEKADLHQFTARVLFNHPSGVFAATDSQFFYQDYQAIEKSSGGTRSGKIVTDNDLWQFNAVVGYRFWRHRGELAVGVLNITDQNYQLHPLTPYFEMPRERTFYTRLRLNF